VYKNEQLGRSSDDDETVGKNEHLFDMHEMNPLSEKSNNFISTTLDEQLDFILKKKIKSESPVEVTNGAPILIGRIRTRKGQKDQVKTIRILLDSGASATLVNGSILKDLPRVKDAKPV